MSARYTETEILAIATRLSPEGLLDYVEWGVVRPIRTESGPLFEAADLARIELLCDLAEHFEIEGEGLAIIMSLIDQLHGHRRRLTALAKALQDEPTEVRQRIIARFAALAP